MKKKTLLLATLWALGTAAGVRADCAVDARRSASLFADGKARRVGDILTVLVSEQTQAVAQATTKAGKSESASLGRHRVLPGPDQEAGHQGQHRPERLRANRAQRLAHGPHHGHGQIRRSGRQPRGRGRARGDHQFRKAEDDLHRPRACAADVHFDNTVASALVADAAVTYEGKGRSRTSSATASSRASSRSCSKMIKYFAVLAALAARWRAERIKDIARVGGSARTRLRPATGWWWGWTARATRAARVHAAIRRGHAFPVRRHRPRRRDQDQERGRRDRDRRPARLCPERRRAGRAGLVAG